MPSDTERLWGIRPLYLQVLFVALAFIAMAVSSSLYVNNMLRNHLRRDAMVLLTQTRLKIEAELLEPETVLTAVSSTIRERILKGDNADAVYEHMKTVANALRSKTKGFKFDGLYGYFDVFEGKYMTTASDWNIPKDYAPTTRPWYKTAVAAKGKAAVTSIYMNVRLNAYIITYTQRIFDKEGQPLGVVCLNVPLDHIISYIADMRLTKSSYGIFHSETLDIFYHPEPEMIGKKAHATGSGLSQFADEVLAGNDLFERENRNYKDELTVAFSTRLKNGWILYSVTPKAEYYQALRDMELILGILGALLAAALISILLRVDLAKKKANEGNRQKSLLLAMMEKEREEEERTQIMLDATPLSCMLWDKDFHTLSCNQETVHLFKLADKQDFLGRFDDLSPGHQPCGRSSKEMSCEYVKKAFEEGYHRFEWLHQTLDGETFPTEVTLVRVKHREEHIVAAYVRDVRELNAMLNAMRKVEDELRLARDAAEAASRAKSAFLANMSHEIRTPMNSIMGFAQLAIDNEIPADAKEYLGKILESAKGLLQIINDILDISKIESGKLELEHISFDLHEIFTHCQTAIMPAAIERGVMMHFYAEPSVGKKLLGDPTKLQQILINFLSNAIKFTNVGTVKLSAAIKKTRENSVTVNFEIRDSGIGMAPEQINRIYEPFMQADSSTTRKYGGTGLGIPIAKSMIEMMGGKLIVESTLGIGSKFSFDITFETIDMPVNMPVRKIGINTLEKPTFAGEVLVCEDNAMNQRVIREHLARVGLQTVVADNGRDGVEMVQRRMENGEKPFDLIFMDIHMPVMDGLEAASKITELGAKTPIVAMTANIMSDDREQYKRCGMPDCVSKPFTLQELWGCLKKYLTPEAAETLDKKDQMEADAHLRRLLQEHFVKNYQTKFDEISTATANGDRILAHRLAHTLKSTAGQIGASRLQHAAADAERLLKSGNLPTEEHMRLLETELNAVLQELAPLLHETKVSTTTLDTGQALALLEQLEPMLHSRNPECLNLLDDIRAMPGAGELVQHMEDFDFKPALASLSELRKKWM